MATAPTPREIAATFYEAFARHDPETMAGLYADTASFEDPVFGHLDASQTRAMWRMLLGRAGDMTATHRVLDSDDRTAKVHWVADYTFSGTGRKVHNEIDTRMVVVDGRIVEQHDSFSMWRWSRQALGPAGLVAGWTPMLRAKVRSRALAGLAREKPAQPGA